MELMQKHCRTSVAIILCLGLMLGLITPVARAAASNAETLPGSQALRLAIADMSASFPDRYTRGPEWLKRLDAIETKAKSASPADAKAALTEYESLRREALLANPLLDFDQLLVIKRDANTLALPHNWESNSSIARLGIGNEIMVLHGLRSNPALKTLYRPEKKRFVGDLSLHFDAGRFMFSSVDDKNRWGVFEMSASGGPPRQLPLIPDADVDNYTSCYLPDDSIVFTSTAPFIGVPCVRGSSHVAHLYRYWPGTGKIHRLTFDQEHSWCPTVMPDGRLLYLRWEYSDLPHYVARILFTMNPDGTNQRQLYGGGSYWPNSFFFAKPMPGSDSKVIGIVTGHHGVPRMGELVIIDPSLSRFEADGVVQRIPGRGQKVEPIIRDQLVDGSWPKFLHPAPLNDKYVIVACKPSPTALWGIYLVDVFDNMTLLKQEPGFALLEPMPVLARPRPPVIPDAVKERQQTARMQIMDIYEGAGLQGVPRGTIKSLRLLTYNFAYHNIGGQVDRVGIDGPWDIKRIIGTVPVESDGSANFEVPANLPISMQPLDDKGRAVALMRSWTTAMPGEVQSCTGCHESQNYAPPAEMKGLAMHKAPAKITPFYGPMRGFHFDRDVQPVLDRHCVSCHNGAAPNNGTHMPDLRRGTLVYAGQQQVKFPPAYVALKSYVRNPTAENDMHTLLPYEFHASTTELVQLLEAGHHGVQLDQESWDRLNTWIDLNTPAWGTWEEMVTQSSSRGVKALGDQRQRRRELNQRYAGIDDDPEKVYPGPDWKPLPVPAEPKQQIAAAPQCDGWPFDASEAKRRQQSQSPATASLDLGAGVSLPLARIPAGRFVAGIGTAHARVAQIPQPFWMSVCEITNEQFAQFDPRHDSRIEHGDFLQFSVAQRGAPLSDPKQPVCHVSWNEAQSFCKWLSQRTGRVVRLPDGQTWEYACRAGAATPMPYGEIASDFSHFANLADVNLRRPQGYRTSVIPEWRPAIVEINDGFFVSAPVGSYTPNAWGLHDMIGNVWEWTTDAAADGVRRIVRGGSWYDCPQRATINSSLPYLPWQKVYNVGFRVIVEIQPVSTLAK